MPNLDAACDEYLANLGHIAESHRGTIGVHLRNLRKKLGEKAILQAWRDLRPRGQYVARELDRLEPLTPKEANARFWQPLRGTTWCLKSRQNSFKVGFHTYRHSFASNLAAAGVDQRVIDEFMGHQTEAMRKRYRHLLPRSRRSAIECFSLAPARPVQ